MSLPTSLSALFVSATLVPAVWGQAGASASPTLKDKIVFVRADPSIGVSSMRTITVATDQPGAIGDAANIATGSQSPGQIVLECAQALLNGQPGSYSGPEVAFWGDHDRSPRSPFLDGFRLADYPESGNQKALACRDKDAFTEDPDNIPTRPEPADSECVPRSLRTIAGSCS